MKRLSFCIAVCLMIGSANSYALDIKDALGKIGGQDVKSTVGGIVEGVVSQNSKVSPADLIGDNWKYASPSVTFKSDDILKQVGGSAASSTIEKKIAPYYTKIGVKDLHLSVDKDLGFVFNIKGQKIKGNIEKELNSKGMMVFNFAAFNKIKLGKIEAKVTKAGNNANIAFDATQLMNLVKKVSSLAGNSNIKAVTQILDKYDGLMVGVKLTK